MFRKPEITDSCHCHIGSHSQQGSQGATITTVVYGLECSSTPPPYKPCHPVRTVSQDTDPHQGKWPTHPWYPSFHPPQRRKGLCLERSGHLAQWGQTKDPTHTEASVPYQQFSVGCSMLPLIHRSVAVAARQQQNEQWIRAMAGTGSGTKGTAPGGSLQEAL